MITIPIKITLPDLWNTETFEKNDWGAINLIVGSNGTGKSLFAEQLKQQLSNKGYRPRVLNAERLSGLEKQHYNYFGNSNFSNGINISDFHSLKHYGEEYGLSTSAFVILKERLDIRIRIEALLSDIFDKTIRFVEQGGFMIPKIQNNLQGSEYDLKGRECHGLKELITVLTFIYDDSKDSMILDEPELHLHPQFQSFLLNEIRNLAGDPKSDPSKKLFFIITHSPYFVDLRELDDLKSILVAHHHTPLSFVSELTPQEEYVLKRFLPRFNTHHKQFFFSQNPVFVEGYTDQQIITLLFDKLNLKISASGSSIIDVGGKDELAVFFNLCKKLGIKGRIIADLDALFKGKLREVVQDDQRSLGYVQDNGLGHDLSSMIGELERKLKELADDLASKKTSDLDIQHLQNFLAPILNVSDKRHVVITSMLLALQKFSHQISSLLDESKQSTISYILARFKNILDAFAAASVFIIPKGEIEHFYTQIKPDYLNITDSDKNAGFHTERDFILSSTNNVDLETKYSELLSVLKPSVPSITVDLSKHIKYQLVEWFHTVQRGVSRGDFASLEELKTNAKVDFNLFSQLFQITSFEVKEDRAFKCSIKLAPALSANEIEVDFTEKTTAHEFEITL